MSWFASMTNSIARKEQGKVRRCTACPLFFVPHRRAGNRFAAGQYISVLYWCTDTLTCIMCSDTHSDGHTSESSEYDTEAIIAFARDEVAKHSGDPSSHRKKLMLLGIALEERYMETQDVAFLRESVGIQRQLLDGPGDADTDRASAMIDLSGSYSDLYDRTGEENALADAILLSQEALELRPPGHPDRDIACFNVAIYYHKRYQHTGDEVPLVAAIQIQREALSLRPPGHSERADTCANLASYIGDCYSQMEDEALVLKSIHEVIELNEESIKLRPTGHPDRTDSCTNLATSYMSLFNWQEDKDPEILNRVSELQREVIGILAEDHPDLPDALSNLSVTLEAQFQLDRNPTTIRHVAELRQKAVDLLPSGYLGRWRPLALLAALLADPTYIGHDVGAAISYTVEALTSPTNDLPGTLSQATDVLSSLTTVSMDQPSRVALLNAYSIAINLSAVVAGFVLDRDAQLDYLSDLQALAPGAYGVAVQLNEPQKAIQLLERGRGILWSNLHVIRHPQIETVPESLRVELQTLVGSLTAWETVDDSCELVDHHVSSGIDPVEREYEHRQHSRIQEILREVRTLPGMDDFMRGPPLSALLRTADSHPVVVLVASEVACHAMIISDSTLTPLVLPSITALDLGNLTSKAPSAQLRGHAQPARVAMKVSRSRRSPLTKLLEKLWVAVVKPVLTKLGFICIRPDSMRPRIHWCPTGLFTTVPLHAAGIYDDRNSESCMDYVVSSYTPTLATLLRAQDAVRPLPVSSMKLSCVAVPQAQDSALPILHSVRDEVAHVQEIAAKAGVAITTHDSRAATRSAVLLSIRATNMVHISCHGIQDREQSLYSAFHLTDGILTIEDLMDLNLHEAFIAFLSACETAKGEEDEAEEVIHLAATMLSAGFKSIIATMW
jgi:hypothetical protein